jgi:hypothetical protein
MDSFTIYPHGDGAWVVQISFGRDRTLTKGGFKTSAEVIEWVATQAPDAAEVPAPPDTLAEVPFSRAAVAEPPKSPPSKSLDFQHELASGPIDLLSGAAMRWDRPQRRQASG